MADVEALRPELALLGVCALDPIEGIAAFDPEDAEIKRALLRDSARVAAGVLNEKLETGAPFAVGRAESLDCVVLEADAPRRDRRVAFAERGISVRRAQPAIPGQIPMIDVRLELAPHRTASPPWPQRLATLGVFLANGLGIGSWAGAIPRLKADLALSDAGLSVALMAFAAGAILAMLLMGFFGHRLRSGPASVMAGFAFAGALAVLGFAHALASLSVATFLAGMTNGAMDVAMNANASDIERRWGRPIMSSFHAAFSLGGAAGALLGGWLGDRERVWGSWGPL